MSSLQKNVAGQNFTFVMLSATTGAVDASATVTVRVTKDNGTQAASGGSVTNSGNGQYNYAPTQAETNATDVGFLCTATGDIAVNLDFHTIIVDGNGYPGVNLVDIAGQTVTAAAGVTFPSSIASPTNITAGTMTTTTNLTNAPTSGDFTAAMKTSLNAATPASVTGAVGSVTGNVGGNVVGTIGGLSTQAKTDTAGAVWNALTADYVTAGTFGGSSISTAQITTAVLTTQMTESYAAASVVPSIAQLLFEVRGILAENSVLGNLVTTKKIDATTTAHTYTIDANPNPTSITTTT